MPDDVSWGYYWGSVAVLTALLVIPASRLIWTLSVRRLERRRGGPLEAAERQGQLNRARLIAVVVSLVFAMLFNYRLLGMGDGG